MTVTYLSSFYISTDEVLDRNLVCLIKSERIKFISQLEVEIFYFLFLKIKNK